ncbi:hypothetical protein [Pseudaestuariivita sp.]|uniref:hypothetical protein n=1 Tax=Pseudaestuariivita sp. TaxID=2211669 RepID=UPI0040587C9E
MKPERVSLETARHRAVDLKILGHDPVSGPRLLETYRSDPKAMKFGYALALIAPIEVAFDFPIMSANSQIGTALLCLAAVGALILFSRTKRYSRPEDPLMKTLHVRIGIAFVLLAVAVVPYLPIVGILYYQGVAALVIVVFIFLLRPIYTASVVWADA